MEVLWKSDTGIIKWQMTVAIRDYDILHGFWTGHRTGHGMGTANLRSMKEVVLNTILPEQYKAYDALEWDR